MSTPTPAYHPVNPLEDQLRRVLTDKSTPLWDFYTPLASAPLWILVPEDRMPQGADDETELPEGWSPEVILWGGKTKAGESRHYAPVYTSETQALKGMELHHKHLPRRMTYVSAPGHQLLALLWKMLEKVDDAVILLNMGMPEFSYTLDTDMVEILLKRAQALPPPEPAAPKAVVRVPESDPAKFLGPVKDFLAQQPGVLAAWIMERPEGEAREAGNYAYDLAIWQENPEDRSLEKPLETMANALSPVQVEWAVTFLRGDPSMMQKLCTVLPAFYLGPKFPKT